MPLQDIDTGLLPDDGTGDKLRTAFEKVKSNFALLSEGGNAIAVPGVPELRTTAEWIAWLYAHIGQRGEPGGALTGRYVFDPATADADPGVGKLRLNASAGAATALRLSNVTADNLIYSSAWQTIDISTSQPKGYLRVVCETNPEKWALYSVSGIAAPIGYKNISIAYVVGGTGFVAGDKLIVTFTATGSHGDPGSDGRDGLHGGAITARYIFSTSLAVSVPPFYLRMNGTSFAGSSILRVSTTTYDPGPFGAVLDRLAMSTSAIKGYIRLTSEADPLKWAIFSVSSVSGTSRRDIFVDYVSSNYEFNEGEYIIFTFTPTGDAGALVDASVTNAKLANMATGTFKGRTAAGSGNPEDLTVSQAQTLLSQSWVSLAAGTISGSTLTFALNVAPFNTFKKFRLWLYDLRPATSDSLIMRVSTDGTTYNTGSNYAVAYSTQASTPSASTNGGALTSMAITHGAAVAIGAGLGVQGAIDIDLTSAGLWCRWAIGMIDTGGSTRYNLNGSGEIRLSGITHIRLTSLGGYTLAGQYVIEAMRGIT